MNRTRPVLSDTDAEVRPGPFSYLPGDRLKSGETSKFPGAWDEESDPPREHQKLMFLFVGEKKFIVPKEWMMIFRR